MDDTSLQTIAESDFAWYIRQVRSDEATQTAFYDAIREKLAIYCHRTWHEDMHRVTNADLTDREIGLILFSLPVINRVTIGLRYGECGTRYKIQDISALVGRDRGRIRSQEQGALYRFRTFVRNKPSYLDPDEENPIYVEMMGFTVATYNCLKKGNLNTLAQLEEVSNDDLETIRNMGEGRIAEVRAIMAKYDATLAGESLPVHSNIGAPS